MSGMLPPPPDDMQPDTVPPERARESSMPPADLGPTGLALRLLALEAKVDDIHAETLGVSKALHDIRNAVIVISDSLERMAGDVEVIRRDAQGQRVDRQRMRSDLDELEARVNGMGRSNTQ